MGKGNTEIGLILGPAAFDCYVETFSRWSTSVTCYALTRLSNIPLIIFLFKVNKHIHSLGHTHGIYATSKYNATKIQFIINRRKMYIIFIEARTIKGKGLYRLHCYKL